MAYPFPHRPGGGKCDDASMLEWACYQGDDCATCEHYRTWTEAHPYGGTTAYEGLAECLASYAGECPYLSRKLGDKIS